MKARQISTLILIFISFAVLSQQGIYHSEFEKAAFKKDTSLPLLFAADPELNTDKYNTSLDQIDLLVTKLEKKQSKLSEEELLEYLFYKVHNKKLNWYEKYGSLHDLLNNKRYDCLTGTALYAILLEELDIKYAILEFDFHVLLLTQANNQVIMFESTDPIDGFINDDMKIIKRLDTPSSNLGLESVSSINGEWGKYKGKINLRQLAGLQYYNMAIDYHNKNQHLDAALAIEKAYKLYHSDRIGEVKAYIQSFTSDMLAIQ